MILQDVDLTHAKIDKLENFERLICVKVSFNTVNIYKMSLINKFGTSPSGCFVACVQPLVGCGVGVGGWRRAS